MNQMIGLVITRKDIMEIGKNILNLVEILVYIIQDLYLCTKDILLNNYLDEIQAYEQIILQDLIVFIKEHPELNNKFIWIPEGEDYFGICDRHAVVPSDYKKYLDIVDYINSKESIETKDELLNCEVTYKNQLLNNDLLSKVNDLREVNLQYQLKVIKIIENS